MTEEFPADRLAATRHLVAVLRVTLGPDDRISGEVIGAVDARAHRFRGVAEIPKAVRSWLLEELPRGSSTDEAGATGERGPVG